MSEWISIKDSLPRKSICVIIPYNDHGEFGAAKFKDFDPDGTPYFVTSAGYCLRPLFWMKPPAFPEDKKRKSLFAK